MEWMGVSSALMPARRYNIAPTQKVLVMTAAREVEEMTWGIISEWTTGTSKPLINARCETVRQKPSFKSAFSRQRCLVPADGFYEWSKLGKRPHLFRVGDDEPFAIGGFWEKSPESNRCCLLTTDANAVLQSVHHRMPVIVGRDQWDAWLSDTALPGDVFASIVAPYPADRMSLLEVSPVVNNARIDGPECCQPAKAILPEPNALPPREQANAGAYEQRLLL